MVSLEDVQSPDPTSAYAGNIVSDMQESQLSVVSLQDVQSPDPNSANAGNIVSDMQEL